MTYLLTFAGGRVAQVAWRLGVDVERKCYVASVKRTGCVAQRPDVDGEFST